MAGKNSDQKGLIDKPRPTQKTISQLTGLAITTVSKALQGDPRIAAKTRERVEQVAAEIGYVPDRAAQRLRTGKTKVISLILDPHDEILSFGNSMISGIVEALKGSDYHLNITPHFTVGGDQDAVRHIVRNGLADGLIFTRTRVFDERVRYLMEREFPFISHGRTDFSEQHSFFDYDNEAFAYQAAMRLVDKGCRNLLILLPIRDFTFYQHMRYGFMRAVRETGVSYLIPEDVTLDSRRSELTQWAAKLAGSRDMPDGIVCPGESSYFALLAGFREHGLLHGKDFLAVVKTNSDMLDMIDPTVDRIGEDIKVAGYEMGSHLLNRLRSNEGDLWQRVQQPKINFCE